MNENIDNMFDELRNEFPKSIYQKLKLVIYDVDGNSYLEYDEFEEKLFSNLYINYGIDSIGISRDENNLFDIDTDVYMDQENLAIIGKAISIATKHLSKIEFEESK